MPEFKSRKATGKTRSSRPRARPDIRCATGNCTAISAASIARWTIEKTPGRSCGQPRASAQAGTGEKNSIDLGKDSVFLDDVVDILSAKPRKAVVHFGGCNTLDIDDEVLKRFVKDTKVRAVTGYRKPVAWLEAAAFETLRSTMKVPVVADGSAGPAGGCVPARCVAGSSTGDPDPPP